MKQAGRGSTGRPVLMGSMCRRVAGVWAVLLEGKHPSLLLEKKNGVQIEGDKHKRVQSFTVQSVQLCQSTRLIQEESLTVSLEKKTLHVDKWG